MSQILDVRNPDFSERYRCAFELPSDLPASDINRIIQFLRIPADGDCVGESALASIKNNLADSLLKQRSLPGGIREVFESLIADPAQGALFQEYMLQKVSSLADRLPEERDKVALVQLLVRTISEGPDSFAATAILGLDQIWTTGTPLVESSDLERFALKLLDRNLGDASTLAATPVLGHFRPRLVAARARLILNGQGAASSVGVQSMAILLLGRYGEDVDCRIIKQFLDHPDPRLRESAREAEKLFSKKSK